MARWFTINQTSSVVAPSSLPGATDLAERNKWHDLMLANGSSESGETLITDTEVGLYTSHNQGTYE